MGIFSRTRLIKIGAVLAGYVGAALLVWLALYIRQLNTQGPDADASSGMYAFGDFLLVCGVFGVAALVPTGLALYFLRPWRKLWTVLSIMAFALAVTGLLAAAIYGQARAWSAPSGLLLEACAALSVLRMLVAPLMAVAFILSGFIAPERWPRWVMFAAGGIECAGIAYGALQGFPFYHFF